MMKRPKDTLSIAALIAANLVPLAGVLLFGWDAAAILVLYWTENLVVGFYTILKIACLKVEPATAQLGKLFVVPFFCLHFGGFCAVHGVFLLFLFRLGTGPASFLQGQHWAGPFVFLQLLVSVIAAVWQNHPPGIEWPVVCLLVSHGVSFVQNFLLGKEYAVQTMASVMLQPYGRMSLLHAAIIAAGVPVMMLGSPIPMLVILVVLKTFIDVRLHRKSHAGVEAEGGPGRGEQ